MGFHQGRIPLGLSSERGGNGVGGRYVELTREKEYKREVTELIVVEERR